MLAVRGLYEGGQVRLLEPIQGIDRAELYIVVIPQGEASPNPETLQMMKLQEETGFVRDVLADASEDVWNDV